MAGKITTQLVIEGKNNAGKALGQVNKQLDTLSKEAAAAGKALAAALSVGVLAAWVKTSIDAADAAGKSAQATGLAVDEYTALAYAADLSDVSITALDSSLMKFNKTIDQAANGGEKQIAAFDKLGISISNADGTLKSSTQLLAEVSAKFEQMPDGVQKSALAMELFGKSGGKLIPMLKNLEQTMQEARDAGAVISPEQQAAAEAFNDNLTRLGKVSTSAANIVSGELLPTLVDMSEMMVDVSKNTEAASVMATVLGGAIKAIASAAIIAGDSLGSMGRFIGGAAAASVAAAKGDFSQAADIIRMVGEDNAKRTSEAIARVTKLWDGSGDAVAKAATAQKIELDKMADDHAAYAGDIKDIRDQMVKDGEAALKKQIDAERKASSALEKARNEQLDTEKRYKDALSLLRSGGAGEPTFIGAVDLKVAARQALGNGDIEDAKAKAQAALDILQQLAASGENTYGFAGFIKELQGIEQAADQVNVDKAAESLKSATAQTEQLKIELDAIKKAQITPQLDDAQLDAVSAQLQAFAEQMGQTLTIPVRLEPIAPQDYSQPFTLINTDKPEGFATGGHVRGPGSGTSDSIMARLSNGEYVLRAAAVRQYGTNLLDKMNGLSIPKFADGGLVDSVQSGSSSFGTVNLSIDGQSYQMQANEQNFAELVKRQKWKRGSTRT